jgi:hypothetical protein
MVDAPGLIHPTVLRAAVAGVRRVDKRKRIHQIIGQLAFEEEAR